MKQETKNKILGYSILASIMPITFSAMAFMTGEDVFLLFFIGIIVDICLVAIVALLVWIFCIIFPD